MALVTLLKHSHCVPALLSACLPPQSPSPDLRAWGGGWCPRVRGFCSGEMSGLLASGFELSWVQQTWDQVSLGDTPHSVPQ